MAKFFFLIGFLIMGLSGACSINVMFFMGRFEWGIVPIVMAVGGIPFVIGLVILLYSRKAMKNRSAQSQSGQSEADMKGD